MSARRRRGTGPLATLAAVVLLTVVLLAANSRVDRPAGAASTYPSGSSGSATATATATPSAAPTTEAPPPPAQQAVFAGVTSGGEATLALAVDGGAAAAYLCDGDAIEAWLQGTVDGGAISLAGRNGAGLSGTVTDSAVFGTVTTSTGLALPFSATLSAPPAGVYEARLTLDGLATRIGWAVLPDGTQVGVATVGDDKQPAPPLDLGSGGFELDGTTGIADPVAGSDTVVGG
ncbi:serine/threonine protein kinase [Geodermatophilus telluris]|uniref:Serine/threonine protein kinase n=1 Tax=Geodermatophilus telluris TaxID=1190417 RepID=A0A1G6V681_9ACTN|nr:hypothetical protein [Geodermatophilus telluris]SDD49122.1 serine/threonine protein kinase [Geodermatophilus telluris]